MGNYLQLILKHPIHAIYGSKKNKQHLKSQRLLILVTKMIFINLFSYLNYKIMDNRSVASVSYRVLL